MQCLNYQTFSYHVDLFLFNVGMPNHLNCSHFTINVFLRINRTPLMACKVCFQLLSLSKQSFFYLLHLLILSSSPLLNPDHAEADGERRRSYAHRSDDLHPPVPSILSRLGRPGCGADQLLPRRGQLLESRCRGAQESHHWGPAAL